MYDILLSFLQNTKKGKSMTSKKLFSDDTDTKKTDNEDEEAGSQGWHKLQTERILRSAEAGYILLCITTAPDMPKQVYLEEAIDHCVMLCQFHLENTVYPEFDPVYRANSDNSSGR